MSTDSLQPWQYRLTPGSSGAARSVAGYALETGAGLPVVELRNSSGDVLGLLLGFVIDMSNRRLPGDHVTVSDAETPENVVDGLLRRLGGRFLLIMDMPGFARIYPDVSAQVSCVIDRETGTIGSSADALLTDAHYEKRFSRDLFNELGVDGEGWFPAGLTAHRGIERLLPDHMLDLETGKMHRFWPETTTNVNGDTAAIVAHVIEQIQAQIEALLTGPQRVALALTGGHETRMILSCAKPFLKDIDIVTVVGGDRHATDTVLARRIVKTMGLRHIELPRLEATEAQRALFIRRGGHCNCDSNSHFHPSVWPIAETHVFVGGLGGEVGRAFFWHPSDTETTDIDVRTLINRFGLPSSPILHESVGRWLEALPSETDSYAVLDLAYHENRNGPWYAAQFCCDPTLIRHAPIMTRGVIEGLMALPPDWKRNNRLSHAVTEAAWPELLDFPYNSLGPVRDFLAKVQKIAADPRRIKKKLRRILSA